MILKKVYDLVKIKMMNYIIKSPNLNYLRNFLDHVNANENTDLFIENIRKEIS